MRRRSASDQIPERIRDRFFAISCDGSATRTQQRISKNARQRREHALRPTRVHAAADTPGAGAHSHNSYAARRGRVPHQAHRSRRRTSISFVRRSQEKQCRTRGCEQEARPRTSGRPPSSRRLDTNPNRSRTRRDDHSNSGRAKATRERTDNSVKKLPNVKGWRARPTLGTDPVTGKQVRPTKVFATKKAAQDWLTEQRSQWSTAARTPKSTRTFDEVADHWLTLRAADPSIGPNTMRADRESLAYARRGIRSGAGAKAHARGLGRLVGQADRQGRQDAGAGHESRAIIRVKSVMVHARKMRWLTYDPAADLDSPEQRASSSTTSPPTASAGASR